MTRGRQPIRTRRADARTIGADGSRRSCPDRSDCSMRDGPVDGLEAELPTDSPLQAPARRTLPRCPREVWSGCSKTGISVLPAPDGPLYISVLPAPDGPLYTRRAAERTKLLSSHIRPAPEAVTSARADVRPTGAPAFRAFLRHRSTRVPFLRQAGFVALSPRVSLPAPVAPRSSAASRRTAAGSDALPPAGASSTAHASPAAPRSSPAAAGDS